MPPRPAHTLRLLLMHAPAKTHEDDQVVLAITTLGADTDSDAFARALLERRLIACANVVGGVQSTYRWHDTITVDREQLVFMKLVRSGVPALEAALRELHSYEVPELLVFDATGGLDAYLSWVRTETRRAAPREEATANAEGTGRVT